jgi:hypothetical protein
MTNTDHPPPAAEGFHPLAAIAAILIPGAGHVIRGEARRGLLIGGGILGLFFGGILIGGIDVVDRQEDAPWFIGQALVGPIAFGIDYIHQNHFKVVGTTYFGQGPGTSAADLKRSAYPNEGRDARTGRAIAGKPPNIKSLSKVNELGTLYSTIAGMLNVIAVLDAAFPTARRRKPEETR